MKLRVANRKNNELTEGEVLFIDRFLSNGYDRKEACIAAGFKTDHPAQYGGRVLKRPQVQAAIKKEIEKKRESFFIDEMDVKLALWQEANFKGKGSTQSGRIQALVALGKTIGMFTKESGNKSDSDDRSIKINITNYGSQEAKDVTGEVIDGLKDKNVNPVIDKLEIN